MTIRTAGPARAALLCRAATFGTALLALASCGVIYTVPSVHDGTPFATAYGTSLDVRVVRLDHETAAAANLEPFVPARLPAAFQPDAVASMSGSGAAAALAALPRPTARPVARPGLLRDSLPPPMRPEPYRIGVADMLLLAIREPATLEELPGLISAQARRQGYVVQDDGAIAIPDAGRVRVAGMTMQDAEAAIFEALVGAGIDPAFSLEIAEFNSQRVSVGGLVGQPTLVPISLKPLQLHEALQLAGGVTAEDPGITTIDIFRDGNIYQITLDRYLNDPEAQRVILRDGDSIHVGTEYREAEAQRYFDEQLRLRSEVQDAGEAERELFKDRLELGAVERHYAYRAGEVRRPGRMALPFERTINLADVLFDEGGIDIRTADYGAIYVLRPATAPEKYGGLTAYHLDAENAVNLAVATQFEIRPNDIVFVSEQPVTSWNRVISQILPQLFLNLTGRIADGV